MTKEQLRRKRSEKIAEGIIEGVVISGLFAAMMLVLTFLFGGQ